MQVRLRLRTGGNCTRGESRSTNCLGPQPAVETTLHLTGNLLWVKKPANQACWGDLQNKDFSCIDFVISLLGVWGFFNCHFEFYFFFLPFDPPPTSSSHPLPLTHTSLLSTATVSLSAQLSHSAQAPECGGHVLSLHSVQKAVKRL